MGGGDLNTKKSWHPNTMKNQEKVWKAEQAEADEKRRINDLRREIDNERSKEELTLYGQSSGVLADNKSKKMDWMYKQPHEAVDREQYLLGKKIDKTFEKILSEEKSQQLYLKAPPKNHVEHECIPFSIRNLIPDADPNECQVDMARKFLEDPLVAIKKRELESRSQLLQNPVKLKELTMLLKMEQAKKKKKKEKKSKKEKKGSVDIDKKLTEKLIKLKRGHDTHININDLLTSTSKNKAAKKKKKKRKYSSESDNDANKPSKEMHNSRKESIEHECDRTYKNKEHISQDRDKKKRYYLSPDNEKPDRSKHDKNRDKYLDIKDSGKHSKISEKNNEASSSYHWNSEDDDDDIPRKKNFGLVKADGRKMSLTKKYDSSRPIKPTEKVIKKYDKPHHRSQLSEAEKEAKRKEMMENAIKRDKDRQRNVSFYKEQDQKQEARDKNFQYKDDFIEKHLRETAKYSSVESRIKSNVYNIQRSSRDMNKNFAKR